MPNFSVWVRGALALCRVDGVETNLGLYAELADDPEFAVGGVDTAYLARFLEGRA